MITLHSKAQRRFTAQHEDGRNLTWGCAAAGGGPDKSKMSAKPDGAAAELAGAGPVATAGRQTNTEMPDKKTLH